MMSPTKPFIYKQDQIAAVVRNSRILEGKVWHSGCNTESEETESVVASQKWCLPH